MPADRIAEWNGTAWTALSTNTGDDVYALTVYNGNLIVGGDFPTIGGNDEINFIAQWDGTVWSALGTGMTWDVQALSVYNGYLIAGGNFTFAGGTAANCIAQWDGTAWSALGSGMNGPVNLLAVYNGELIAGGSFSTAGGNISANWARWGPIDSDADGVPDCMDNCPDIANPGQEDCDGDGYGDVCGCNALRGDMNDDGVINAADIQLFVEAALGG